MLEVIAERHSLSAPKLVLGDDAGRCESVRTTGEVVGLVSDRQSRLERKMKSKVAIGITTTMEMY